MAEGLNIRDRVVELRRCKPSEVDDHPHQWRLHPHQQREVLTGSLREIGMADALLVWRSARNNNRLTAFDGHLRKSLDPDLSWPTLVTDLTDAEADTMLLLVDPITSMATADKDKLDALLRDTKPADAALQQFLSELAAREGIIPPDFQPVGIDEQGRLDEKAKVTCPNCGEIFEPKG
jgi:hypothetical protein